MQKAVENEGTLSAINNSILENADGLNVGTLRDDQNMHFSREKWDLLRKIGLTRINVSSEYGGYNFDVVQVVSLLKNLGKHCKDSGLGFTLCTHLCSTCISIERFASDISKKRYLSKLADGSIIGAHAITEASGGSNAFSMATSAERTEGGWRITGQKHYVTNAPIADLVVVYAKTAEGKKALGGVSAFIVDTTAEGVSAGENIPKMGLKTSQMSTLSLDEVFVPESALLGKEGMAFTVLDYVMKWEILCVFAIQTGEMLSRVGGCIEHARRKQDDGSRLADFQSLTHRVVNMHIEVETAAMWLDRAVNSFSQNRDATINVAIAKLIISESNLQSSIEAFRVFGGVGYLVETGLEKQLRDSAGSILYSGTSDIQRNRVAGILGL